MEIILVDTSVWINFFKDVETDANNYLNNNFSNIIIAICPVIMQEILQGIISDKEKEIVNYHFNSLTKLIENSYQMAIEAADIYRTLRKKGMTIRKSNDCLIAAYAIKNDVALLHDDKDFTNIAAFTNLKPVRI